MTHLNWINLGFPPPSKETRVVVAMSGGVDSSVTASLLAEAGYDVVGITLQLYDHGMAIGKTKACCAGQDIYDASQVATKMGFPHYVLDYESVFKQQVMDDFADSYLRGETPIPCVQCNQQVKFKDLLKTAKDLGGHCLVTGHYVQRLKGEEKAELHQAVDPTKDQSYFLFATRQEELDYLRFPLGGLTKAETRQHAKRFGLSVADKPDSQDICFVPNGDYASVVQKLRPGAADPGEIVHVNGSVLGRHPGIIHYTIGQRKGLGIGGSTELDGKPLYVVRLNAHTKEVIVGSREDLAQTTFTMEKVNWLGEVSDTPLPCTVKIRSSQTPLQAEVTRTTTGASVTLLEPEYGISPGQACVFYEGTRVVGGGWIAMTRKMSPSKTGV
ncbi:MAG: tRNA 2-thiouridine(34) synthase MnmA [Alphaproteobacteria bacterium RIFCSPLOWO2_01_FULL_45_8]|nr:MAG: tRNA 2-thiouridine(34) synthase MnmA [Alphaproteobacteria bacterium GWA1_45_9]OFW90059.1 MAG: tRNA 2-thiouridine(34) synthase MnmA [Alphaproteobacteria bacterium RIFCSPHIGHO2_01_FULL_41_14]OFW96289.1 MAG: tRNA 2-thiouridine(34) synthase MnmA [Alphaproteobacteria bacterium RIFCSPLOWO2_01_FULL_45_8]HCI48565.1 tRNA 2-thiouridine(34) synthase MnmA [Holosporales bacterium]